MARPPPLESDPQCGDPDDAPSILRDAISRGAPLYNSGSTRRCFELYLDAAVRAAAALGPDRGNGDDDETAAVAAAARETLSDAAVAATHASVAGGGSIAVDGGGGVYEGGDEEEARLAEGCWILRRCFDEVLSREGDRVPSSSARSRTTGGFSSAERSDATFSSATGSEGGSQAEEKMVSLSQLMWRAKNKDIRHLQGGRDPSRDKERFELYLKTINTALSERSELRGTAVGQWLDAARDEGRELASSASGRRFGEAAWVLRHAFDSIQARQNDWALIFRIGGGSAAAAAAAAGGDGDVTDGGVVETDDVFGRAQVLSDAAYILRLSLSLHHCTRFRDSFPDCFEASDAVEALTSLGLCRTRKEAASRCALLARGGFLWPVSHPHDPEFKDSTRLFRFGHRDELTARLHQLVANSETQIEGSESHVLHLALELTLEMAESRGSGSTDGGHGRTSANSNPYLDNLSDSGGGQGTFAGVPTRLLGPRRTLAHSPERIRGNSLADLSARVERTVDIADRRYHLRTYRRCFVGQDAVTKLIEEGVFSSRREATSHLGSIVSIGLVQHVTRDHAFKDERYFYRFATAPEIKAMLDEIDAKRDGGRSFGCRSFGSPAASRRPSVGGRNLVQYSALVARYKQHCGSQVKVVLNDFYNSCNESEWDESSFEGWRRNMLRWGFATGGRGRDEETVDRLATFVRNIDPRSWREEENEDWVGQWESPFGILSQVAIFHVIPRALLKGTRARGSQGYRWDTLALYASKRGLQKGYFDSAYTSTLNQFLLLLPLAHSQSWEDQKLGVTLLLQLLPNLSAGSALNGGGGSGSGDGSCVRAVGCSDLEMVKRIEFARRLASAFLRHSRAVARLKRYPQRSFGEAETPLEESIWTAAEDAAARVRRFNPEDAKNIIKAAVIPRKVSSASGRR